MTSSQQRWNWLSGISFVLRCDATVADKIIQKRIPCEQVWKSIDHSRCGCY